MPKNFSFAIGEEVVVTDKVRTDLPSTVGLKGKIVGVLDNPLYDYEVKLSNGYIYKFKENELNLYNKENEKLFKIGDSVRVKHTGEIGFILKMDETYNQVEIRFENGTMKVFDIDKIELVESTDNKIKNLGNSMKINSDEHFKDIGYEIGRIVDSKQKAYGDSVRKTYELMQIYLDKYDNGNNTYTIPKELLKHILLQVRIIDKQNRIFNNPDRDLMEENPYSDITGYGMLGMNMFK